MNYCFLARPAFDVYSPKIFLDIKNRYDKKAVGVFIVTDNKEAEKVKKTYPEAITYETSRYISDHWNEFNYVKFCEYEKKYDCAPLWKYVYTDRYLIYRDFDYVVRITVGLFSFFEYVFSKHNINIYYSETIATLQCYVAYLVGKKTGAKYYAQTSARGFSATMQYVMNDPYQSIYMMNNDYNHDIYTEEELRRAKDFLDEFLKIDQVPVYMISDGQKPRFKFSYLALPFLRFVRRFNKRNNNPCSYMYYESYKHITDPIKFFFRYHYCRHYYTKADISKKYVLFPLHYQPEASTIVCAQKYEKQLFFIDSLAKSLPADTVLYVKEHYAFLGHRDVSFYKELQKYPNVFLIDPWEKTRELIKHAEAITTLTGTAGWEAMLFRKPVIVGGNIFYENAPGVIKVEDIFDNYIKIITSWKKPTEEELLRYLCSYIRALSPGRNWFADSDDNITKVVDGLMAAVNA